MSWFVPATFAVSLTIILGIYWLFIVRPETESHTSLAKRLGKMPGSGAKRGESLVKEAVKLSSIPQLDAALEKAGHATGRLQQLIESSDVKVTVGKLVLGCALLGVVAFGLVAVATRQTGLAAVAGIAALMAPVLYLQRKRTVRLRAFEEQFPEAIDLIARAMRAGHGLTGSLSMVAEEIGPPVGREFRLLFDWQNFGMSLPEAFQRFAARVPLLDARFFVTSVLTQREAGGNLAEVLDNLAKVIRERFRVKRQIRVVSAHGRMTGLFLACLPPVLALYFLVAQPDYMASLVSDPLGVRLIIGALVLQVIGMFIIRRLVDVEY